MKIGIIKPNYPNEKRVALLPQDIHGNLNELIVEENFGGFLDVSDSEYIKAGAKIRTREGIFAECDVIFSLKLLQEVDYKYVREGQTIVGWTHPNGSGADFMKKVAVPKKLKVIDLDNIFPTVYYQNKKIDIDFIQPNFIWKNSFNAGYSSIFHALVSFGLAPETQTKVAVLSVGNVSQGALSAINKFNTDTRVFYRKTMNQFYDTLADYDIIINGIEVDNSNEHIIDKNHLDRIKKGCLVIDAAADAGNAIEGTVYTSIDKPIYQENGIYFYVVNNAPSIFYRKSSIDVSKALAKVFFNENYEKYQSLITK